MRGIIEYSVRHRVTMIMITAAAVLFGVVSLGRLPLQLLPDLSYPTLTIQTEYPDSGPSEVENLITRPLEEAAGVIPGIRRIDSVSESEHSEITLEFGWDTDMDFAALDVREKIDLITLPDDAETPVLLRYDPSLDPVIRLGVSGEANQVQLRYLAEHVVKKELESLPGVAAAKVVGGLTEEVHVNVDEQRLAALGIPVSRVAELVGAENVNAAGGRLRDRDAEYLVRTVNQFAGAEDVAQTILLREGGKVVKLSDVAEVTRAYKEREIVTRIDGAPAVEVAIYKEGNANIVETAKRIRRTVPGLEKLLPAGAKVQVLSDQSTFIQSAIDQVKSNAIQGGLLAILVLLVFLRDLRSTAIIAMAIPISIIATFVLMFRQGVSLNVMSLGGLALGVGMLVDNSIVVLESIVRHRRQGGKPRIEAVVDGTQEVAMAISASTLTTVAVFLPILFVEGVARQIFKDQALTVTYSLLVSLVVALTVTPMIAAIGGQGKRRGWAFRRGSSWIPFLRRGTASANEEPERLPPSEGHDPLLEPVYRIYERVLGAALRRRAVVILGTTALFALSVVGVRALGMNLIPSFTQGEFRFSLELAEATPLERTDAVVTRIESSLRQIPSVETVFTNVGLDTGENGSVRSKKENHAELNVHLHEGAGRQEDAEALAEIRRRLAEYPEVTATLQQATAFTFKTPIQVEIYGYDLGSLTSVSNQVADLLHQTPGLKDVAMTMEPGDPEVQIRFDRDKLKLAGLGLRESSDALRTQILGRVATDFKDRDRQIDVRVRGGESQTLNFAELPTLVVGYREGVPVRLASVADVAVDRGPARIQRIAQSRAAVVSANLVGRDLGTVSTEIEGKLASLSLPPSVTVQLGGQNEEMEESLRSLLFAGALAIFLIYLVMACQFESLLDPFLIMFAVPLALIGVVAGLVLTSTPVSVVVLIGGIMLAGIVVNNGIVLLDLVGQLQRRGMPVREALLEAGRIRIRPILMTTGTTVLGLAPLAFGHGEGSELMAPLAVTVMGGLTVSTLLTLVFIPVLYTLVHRDARGENRAVAPLAPRS